MSLVIEYLQLQQKFEQQYGERTIVLMQQGTFFETYEYNIDYCCSDEAKKDSTGKIWNESVGHAIEICSILNFNIGYIDGHKPYSVEYCHKVGFPIIAYEKCRSTLLSADFT